jgi:hypothetical protein
MAGSGQSRHQPFSSCPSSPRLARRRSWAATPTPMPHKAEPPTPQVLADGKGHKVRRGRTSKVGRAYLNRILLRSLGVLLARRRRPPLPYPSVAQWAGGETLQNTAGPHEGHCYMSRALQHSDVVRSRSSAVGRGVMFEIRAKCIQRTVSERVETSGAHARLWSGT